MIGKREIRLALTGAVLFLVVGAVQACSSEQVAGPELRAQHDQTTGEAGPVCVVINGQMYCQ